MNEGIWLAVIALDEAEALHRVEELDGALSLFAGQLALRPAFGPLHRHRLAFEARVDFLLAPGALADVRREVVETMAKIDPAAYRIGAEAVWLADQRDRAAAIDIPTLVICGEEDKVTPPSLSEDLAAIIPEAKLETIPGAGHISNLERPAEFNRIVEEFIGNG